jgi:hypothetical protein
VIVVMVSNWHRTDDLEASAPPRFDGKEKQLGKTKSHKNTRDGIQAVCPQTSKGGYVVLIRCLVINGKCFYQQIITQ